MFTVKRIEKSDLPEFIPTLKKIAESGGFSEEEVPKLHHVFVAFNKNDIAGFAGVTCYRGYWALRLCIVSKKYRGMGLQKLLIKKRLEFLKQKGTKWANVWVSPHNIYSLNNVISQGFKFVKEKPRKINGTEYVKLRKIF